MAIVTIDGPVQPSENWRFGLGFTKRLPAGVTIAAVDSVTVRIEATGADVSSTILVAATSQIDSGAKSASARFAGFAGGVTYIATFKVTLTNGEKREGDVLIPCVET